MRALLLLVALAFLAVAQAAPALTVTTAAKYSSLLPTSASTFQYLYYVSNTTWRPSSLVWDCTQTPGVCTTNCGYYPRDLFNFPTLSYDPGQRLQRQRPSVCHPFALFGRRLA